MNVSQNITLRSDEFQTFNSAYCEELQREEDKVGVVVTASPMALQDSASGLPMDFPGL